MAFTTRWTPEALATFNRLQANRLHAEAQESLQNRNKNKRTKATKAEGLFKQTHQCVDLVTGNPRRPARIACSGAMGQGRQS